MISDMGLCLLVFIFCCLFVLALAFIFKNSNPVDAGLKEYGESAYDKYVKAKNNRETGGAILYASLFLFRGSYIGLTVTIALAAFSCLGMICSGWGSEELEVVRKILADFYKFASRE